jgi:DNA-directed DNA polymerase III PolC
VPYAELHCLSNFTFLRGASHPEELVSRAAELGYAALAITDECSLAGVVRAHIEAKKAKLPLVIGSEFKLDDGLRLVLLATNRSSYGNLSALITRGRCNSAKGSYRLTRADLALGVEGCLALWLPGRNPQVDEARWLSMRFPGALWIAAERLLEADDAAHCEALMAIAQATRLSVVAAGDVHMHARERRAMQDTLTAIRLKTSVAQAGYALYPNGERHLRPLATLERLYPAAWLVETLVVAERCKFSLDELRYEYPEEIVPKGETPTSYLRRLTEEGFERRFPLARASEAQRAKVRKLIEHELELIAEARYEAFFLTVYDVVEFARREGILCQGRGSAANSAVCYCLGITEVDPSRMEMLFERFISRERNEPPDIDVDFEHQRREEVIQYIYRKYTRARAALTATVVCYRVRSALRDVGKALGLDLSEVDRLAKAMAWWDGRQTIPRRLSEAGFDAASPLMQQLFELVATLLGFPRHLSQHTGGFVISRGPLAHLVPVENAAMPERTVIEWDKDDLDALGLLKVDVLALGMLSAIRRALVLVSKRYGRPFAITDVPPEDEGVYAMIGHGDTVGVFQIESRAQMAMLPRLKPKNYYDLVIEVAIVRPGPIQGGMVHPYLRRRQGTDPVTYPSDAVRGVLERTLGVPIFQEQVMQLAVVAAGFTPGESDQLRRSMAAWKRKGGLEHFERRLIEGMRERNYDEAFARQIYQQILGFGEYGFPECVVGETRVVDADTGRWVTVDEIFSGRVPFKNTLACDDELRLQKRKVIEVRASGTKPVWRLHTALGHTVTATAEHPFMVLQGWRKLGELRTGDYVAAVRSLRIKGLRRWPAYKIRVLADLITEGNVCHPSIFYFYTTASWHCDEFVKAVERFPNTRAVVERHRSCFSVRVRRVDRSRPIGAVVWIRRLGIWGCTAPQKFLPPQIFELSDSDIALLLSRLWEGDGGLSLKGHAAYDTASPRLATELQHLLLRLGIVARLYRRVRSYKGRKLEHYAVTVTGKEPLTLFWQHIGRRFLDPEKRRRSEELAACRNGRMSRDIISAEVREVIRRERDIAKLSWAEIGRKTGLGMREIQARRSDTKIGFRRFVIERLAKVLHSPRLQRLADSDVYWDRVVRIEAVGCQPTYDLQIEGNHNFLANNLVVHNSHAASFALLVYVSAWLKHYEPAAFTCALLNSQPMGFYSPSQLTQDLRRHDVEILPADVTVSEWECTLEPAVPAEPVPIPGVRTPQPQPALRLGLCLVKGLSEAGGKKLVAVRAERAFTSVADLARRGNINAHDMQALAAAGALAALSGHRRQAMWDVSGIERLPPVLADSPIEEASPVLAAPAEGEDIVADYASLGLTLGRHPLALLRERLQRQRMLTAAELKSLPHGRVTRVTGLVTGRQRPGTASGVTFVTLEDETGMINVIVWNHLAERQRKELLRSSLMTVYGTLEREGEVVHLIAARLRDQTPLLGKLTARSRDFR